MGYIPNPVTKGSFEMLSINDKTEALKANLRTDLSVLKEKYVAEHKALLRGIGVLPPEERPEYGKIMNALYDHLKSVFKDLPDGAAARKMVICREEAGGIKVEVDGRALVTYSYGSQAIDMCPESEMTLEQARNALYALGGKLLGVLATEWAAGGSK